MEPNMKLILDELSQLNRRFDDEHEHWNQRFSDLERSLTSRATTIDARFDALETSRGADMDDLSRRIADLEAAPTDPQIHAVESRLATLEASYSDRDAAFTQRLSELERLRVNTVTAEHDVRVANLEEATKALNSWRPEVDGVLDDVQIAVRKLEKGHDRQVFDEVPLNTSLLPTPNKAAARSSAGFPANQPVVGHRFDSTPRDSGSGVVTTWIPVPANGTLPAPPPHFPAAIAYPPPRPPPPDPLRHNDPKGRLPKVLFPRFDGEQPRRWKTRAEKYFRMYFVEPSLWISVSEMHFDGAASLWYQSIEDQVTEYSWPEFCALLLERFDRDQHEYLIRQLFHVHQTTTVAEYLSRFTQLADQLKAYNPKHDQLYFTMRFIDGLRPDIKSVVLLQRPKTLDTAATLALLQEEVTSPCGRIGPSGDWSTSSRPTVPAR
jgi:hypothetical protein